MLLPGVALASEARSLPVDQLGSFQKADQRKEIKTRAELALSAGLTEADAPAAVRLLLNDAATYDAVSGTGGVDGSIVTPEELGRPENASLKPLVERLADLKKSIDAGGADVGQGPISWADLIVLAAKVSTQKVWYRAKVGNAKTETGGELIASAFSAEWPVQLGRVDSNIPAPPGRLLPENPTAEEVQKFFLQLGVKPGEPEGGLFAPKKPFWERVTFVLWPAAQADPAAAEALLDASPAFEGLKRKYDISRRTATRTDYEVDFITYSTKLANLGAKFDPNAYLYPIKLGVVKL